MTKRIMKELPVAEPVQFVNYNQGILQDGIVDWLEENDDYDTSGSDIMYCSQLQMVDDVDGEGKPIKVKKDVVLVPLNAKVKPRPAFAGYDAVGNEDEQ